MHLGLYHISMHNGCWSRVGAANSFRICFLAKATRVLGKAGRSGVGIDGGVEEEWKWEVNSCPSVGELKDVLQPLILCNCFLKFTTHRYYLQEATRLKQFRLGKSKEKQAKKLAYN